jgi:hypothetical protein
MPIPEERVYYYEQRESGAVLLCWVPPAELAALVDNGVKDAILDDHPGGVDIEVTPEDFEYYEDRYRLRFAHSPRELLVAFEAIASSDQVSEDREIRGDVVEQLAAEAGDAAGAVPTGADGARDDEATDRAALARLAPLDEARSILIQNPAIQQRIDDRLSGLRRTPTAEEETQPEESPGTLGAVRRSDGQPAAVVFAGLQQQSARRN